MKRRSGIGVGLLASLVVSWSANQLSPSHSEPADPKSILSTKGKSKSAVGSSNKSDKGHHSTPSESCTAYLGPDLAEEPVDENRGAAKGVIDRFLNRTVDGPASAGSLTYVIALVPDPRHTRLTMMFDRSLDAISDGASDSDYRYDSAWLPWQLERQKYDSRDDRMAEKRSMEGREKCPGFMLFRKRGEPYKDADSPYKQGLLVFLVGEQPTGGVNPAQWDEAVRWINDSGETSGSEPLRVLGPTFSGTLPSFAVKLAAAWRNEKPKRTAMVFSGTVGSCKAVNWFESVRGDHTFFRVFQENDEIQLTRLFRYLGKDELKNVAILSEDETAYGGSLEVQSASGENKKDDCPLSKYLSEEASKGKGPVSLFYPRDISALRAAYQSQSIFSQGQSTSEKQGPHTVLSDDVESEANEEGDTPPSYSTEQSALTEEAELYGAVSFLRSHHTHYVVLRGSNPLDYLFLTRFLHHAYPEGRVIVVGSEILFTRELDTTEFRGSLALTNFPLLPRLQHWSQIFQVSRKHQPKYPDDLLFPAHGHRAFPSTNAEGLYIASRFLLKAPPLPEDQRHNDVFYDTIPDFADPAWLQKRDDKPPLRRSNTWLTVLGRDGYWPVALIKDDQADSSLTAAKMYAPIPYDPVTSPKMDPSMPWFILAALSGLLIAVHGYRCSKYATGHSYAPTEYILRAGFTPRVFIALTTAFVFETAFLLFIPFSHLRGTSFPMPPEATFFACCFGLIAVGSVYFAEEIRSPFFAGLVLAVAAGLILALWPLKAQLYSEVSTYYREIHLSNGVNPVIPLLFLGAGLYIWAWQSLAAARLLGPERPLLPDSKVGPKYLRASETLADRIDALARPFTSNKLLLVKSMIAPMIVAVIGIAAFVHTIDLHSALDGVPILSFEGPGYGIAVSLLILSILMLIALGLSRLLLTWRELKRLLRQLDQMPLRRTFEDLRGIRSKSLWSMSRNVGRSQFKFFQQQLEAVQRLRPEFRNGEKTGLNTLLKDLKAEGDAWSEGYLATFGNTAPWTPDLRTKIAVCAGKLLYPYLNDKWDDELLQEPPPAAQTETPKTPLSKSAAVRAAEEFICLLYVGYLQTVLATMRTMVIRVSALTVSMMLALAFYPFANRPSLSVWMLLVFIAIGAVVAVVYAGLEHDPVLSSITNTKDELGWEFWSKYIVFLLPPALALITTQFPEIAISLQRWVQPGIDAVK